MQQRDNPDAIGPAVLATECGPVQSAGHLGRI